MSSLDPAPTARTPDGAVPDTASPAHPAAVPTNTASPALPVSGLVGPVPDAATLERVAEPAVVRRAPRYGAFIRAGVVLGAVIGWMVAALAPSTPDEPRSAVIGLTALGLAGIGALLGAGLAVLADRRSDRGR